MWASSIREPHTVAYCTVANYGSPDTVDSPGTTATPCRRMPAHRTDPVFDRSTRPPERRNAHRAGNVSRPRRHVHRDTPRLNPLRSVLQLSLLRLVVSLPGERPTRCRAIHEARLSLPVAYSPR